MLAYWGSRYARFFPLILLLVGPPHLIDVFKESSTLSSDRERVYTSLHFIRMDGCEEVRERDRDYGSVEAGTFGDSSQDLFTLILKYWLACDI